MIKLVIDSGADILPEEAEKLGITYIPMVVTIDGVEYLDSVTLTHKGFYEKLVESDALPKTSQITPSTFAKVFEDLTKNGDTVLAITLSSKLSGTYQSACVAASEFPGQVYVIDSLNVCIGERIFVERAQKLIDDGMEIEELIKTLEEEKQKIRILAALDTLEYLKKGGRISTAVAIAGNLLSIKPVVSVIDGAVELVGKARGSKNTNNLLRTLINKGNGIDFSKPVSVAYSGLTDQYILKYLEDHKDIWEEARETLKPTTVGCIIGTHVGPGAVAVAFFEK